MYTSFKIGIMVFHRDQMKLITLKKNKRMDSLKDTNLQFKRHLLYHSTLFPNPCVSVFYGCCNKLTQQFNENLLCYSSERSEAQHLTHWAKSRRKLCILKAIGGESVSLPFLASRGHPNSLTFGTFLHFQSQHVCILKSEIIF